MVILRYIKLNIPVLLYLIWAWCFNYYYFYYIGSIFFQSKVKSVIPYAMGLMIPLILLVICGIACLCYFVQLFTLLHKKNYHKCIQNIIAIIIFLGISFSLFIYNIRPCREYIPFALGLKNYFEKQIHLNQFQQWVESPQIDKKMIKGRIVI
jgi:ABC-type uncharacterized transport system fused permease/ATPase subunit